MLGRNLPTTEKNRIEMLEITHVLLHLKSLMLLIITLLTLGLGLPIIFPKLVFGSRTTLRHQILVLP